MDITSGLLAPANRCNSTKVNQNNQILNGGALGMISMAQTSQSTAHIQRGDFTGRYMRELSDKVKRSLMVNGGSFERTGKSVTPSWYLVEEPDEDDSDDVRCCVCRSGRKPDSMLLCDGKDCQRGCHMHCLRPRLVVPADTWLCPVCKFNRTLSEE
ncbi:histone-lysine N-methyltransferase ATXR5 [Planoprotostelium fungivorum]|uniref:Histone-lysine N-methyltransferase ATXR5 n=1 Tax=Planoprotostelium fungivorum TaxID=1890364 RepID=A0A2P6MQD9_9EUKA|nr:histone-lysine N-methyltransferase ATXR5 [Planoprotostelium fungivorum]